ncbi:MAG: YdbH domain-containing protein [Alphaproteobacteria bacterium]|nr:YdbH domain-containing protein [Alphaproteobacteria bacterium]
MANDNTNGTQQNATPSSATKTPLIKRIKVPTIRKETPVAQPAPQSSAAESTDPAAQLEAQHTETAEPELPPEEKKNTNTSAAASEKASIRRKNRNGPNLDPNTQPLLDEGKPESKQAKELKIMVKKLLSNKLIRFAIILFLLGIICAGVYSSLPIIAEKKLPALFAANGMPFKKFTLKELTSDTMVLTNVADKTGTMTVSSIKFNYSLFDLYKNNTIRSMELSGVTINGEKRNDGISLGVLDDLISSPISARKDNMLTINSLRIQNGTLVLKNDAPPEKIINEDGEEEEIDNTIFIKFNANGSWNRAGLNLQASTDYTTPFVSLKVDTSLNKTAMSSRIKAEITEGNVLKKEEKIGSVTGNLEIAVDNGVLSTGTADLLISSSSQKLKLLAGVTPKESGFDISVDLDRSFDDPKDAIGKFVGSLSLKAENVTIKGTFQKFDGMLPLHLEASSLTNGQTAIRDLNMESDLKFSCAGANCSFSLNKPMKFAFSGLQTTGLQKQIKFLTPVDLTLIPDSKESFLRFENNVLSLATSVSGFKTQLYLADDYASSQIAAAINGLKTRIKYNVFSGAYSGDATFVQSGFADKDIRMTGIQGVTVFSSASLPEARLRVSNVTLAKPDILPEFSMDLRIRPQNRGEFGINSDIQIQNGLASANINGSYSLVSREWDLSIVVPKLVLSDSGLKLSTVFPFMLNYVPDTTTGTVAAKGRIAIKNKIIAGPLNILLENIQTDWNNIRFDGVTGVITLTSLSPLATPENQQLSVNLLKTGIPFQNALFTYQIQPDKGVEIANARMKYADGQFKTIKSFTVSPEGRSSQILLEGNGINMSILTQNMVSDALQADGILNSEWILSFAGKNKPLNIEKALFTSKLPGTLHFTAPKSLQSKMNPQMQSYLKDVIVKKMKITAKGQIDRATSFNVSITGHSPLETEANDQEVAFDFKGSFKSLLKQDVRGIPEIPPEILQAVQNYSK